MARLTHAPDITLIYESGTIGTAPDTLPLSIGDGELCDTAMTTVSVPEMFRYWLQGGHITIGFLGAAQIDRFGNINTTVIGDYDRPKTRLPGGGGAPEIASLSQKVFVTMKQSRRGMVDKIDFFTSFGHGEGGDHRRRMNGVWHRIQQNRLGPAALITDLAVWKPDEESGERLRTADGDKPSSRCHRPRHGGRTKASGSQLVPVHLDTRIVIAVAKPVASLTTPKRSVKQHRRQKSSSMCIFAPVSLPSLA